MFKKRLTSHLVPIAISQYISDSDLYRAFFEGPSVDVVEYEGLKLPYEELGHYREPLKYEIVDPCMADATFLEDARHIKKPEYRMRSELNRRIKAMVLDIDGVWHQTRLKPIIVRYRERQEEYSYGFRLVLPTNSKIKECEAILREELGKKWEGRTASGLIFPQVVFRYELPFYVHVRVAVCWKLYLLRSRLSRFIAPKEGHFAMAE